MGLSNDLISQFVKMTNDRPTKKQDSIIYGTVTEYNDTLYVKLDGSDLLTPVDTSSTMHEGDRVTVNIKDHNATVSGNLTNPSVSGVEIDALDEKLTIMFKDGYYEGITTVNKDGIKVEHTGYGGHTRMYYNGFFLNNGESDVLKCTAEGLVYTGTITASDIRSLDDTFEIDKDGNIRGATFKSSRGGNFSIDEDGEITAAGLTVEDSISSNTLICNNIMNQAYPKTLTGDVNLYINKSVGNNNSECVNGAVYATLQGAIEKIPKFLNGKTVRIYLQNNNDGNINLKGYSSGTIYIFLCGYTLYGHIYDGDTTAFIGIYGGNDNVTNTIGYIHPLVGINQGGISTSIAAVNCNYLSLYNVGLYAPDNHASGASGDKVGLVARLGGVSLVYNVTILNCSIGFKSDHGAHIQSNLTYGVASKYGFAVYNGGIISISDNDQSGGLTANAYRSSAGQLLYDSPTFATGNATVGSGSAPSGGTKTVTYYSSTAQAIQYYGTSSARWRTDMVPKVGAWGYGNHVAFWFFGGSFSQMANKKVSKIEIRFTRNRGGYSSATLHNFYAHGYESQPSTTSPSYSSKIGSASIPTNSSGIITITDRTAINNIISRKGICSIPPSQSNTYYSVMSASMSVTFTYTD